jgi:methionyl-tRNA synthetase
MSNEEKNSKGFYITTPIFYPNGAAHMGHAYATVLADVRARYERLSGAEAYFLVGTDENTAKVEGPAAAAGKTVPEYVDGVVAGFKDFFASIGISYDQFIRTSDEERHWPGVVAVWNRLAESGDIYKSRYEGLYCVGCESFKTEKDLVDGKCPDHNTEPERITEENYFFRLSKYTDAVKQKIESGEFTVMPETRRNEILSLLGSGLEDISFSRPAEKIPWGVPVPGDPAQSVYVWCDALVNYISALGFGREDDTLFRKFWPADFHVVGKDILRFHAAIWPAMLLAAKIPLPQGLMVHGLLLSGGKKMSKTLGNIVDPVEFVRDYGSEALRFYLASQVSPFDDGDITAEKFHEVYTAELVNGYGNLISRILKMYLDYGVEIALADPAEVIQEEEFADYRRLIEGFEVHRAVGYVMQELRALDQHIQETKPFKVVKENKEEAEEIVAYLALRLWDLSVLLSPVLPNTFEAVRHAFEKREMVAPLFARK